MLNVTQTNSAEYSKRVFMKNKFGKSSSCRSSVTHRHRPRISAPSRESLDTVNKSTESSKYLALLLQLNFTVNFREQNQVFLLDSRERKDCGRGRAFVREQGSVFNRNRPIPSAYRDRENKRVILRRFRHGPCLKSQLTH